MLILELNLLFLFDIASYIPCLFSSNSWRPASASPVELLPEGLQLLSTNVNILIFQTSVFGGTGSPLRPPGGSALLEDPWPRLGALGGNSRYSSSTSATRPSANMESCSFHLSWIPPNFWSFPRSKISKSGPILPLEKVGNYLYTEI